MNTNLDFAPQEDDAAKALAADLASLEAELATQKNLCLRLAADFDNFRKRTAQETDRRAAAQKEAFIRELLPVIDNLERALASDASVSPEQLRQGVQMTLQQLYQLLRQHGIEPEESGWKAHADHRVTSQGNVIETASDYFLAFGALSFGHRALAALEQASDVISDAVLM